MFERTVSLWRRLTAPRSRQTDAAVLTDDRRVWVRFPADLETTYRPAGAAAAERFPAVLRDISVGGVSLSVDRPFLPGDLLTVELPTPAEGSACTVLACVVHVEGG